MTIFRSSEQARFAAILAAHLDAPAAPLLLEGGAGLGKTRAILHAAHQHIGRTCIALPSWSLIDQLLASRDLEATRNGRTIGVFRPRRMFGDRAAFEAAAAEARAADIMVCTSAAVIIDNAAAGDYCGAVERTVIFDEADQLPSAAALRIDLEIPAAALRGMNIAASLPAQEAARLAADRADDAETRGIARLLVKALVEGTYGKAGRTADGGLALFHPRPGRLLKRVSNTPATVFVSATLSIGDSFDAFKRAMAIDQVSTLSTTIEPLRHGDVTFSYQPLEIESDAWRQAIVATVAAARRPVLVATPSHALAAELGGMLTGATVRGEAETMTDALARLPADGVLVAAGAWAGFDAALELATIVVPQVPFARLREVDGVTVGHYLDARADVIRRLRQVVGRGTRHAEQRVHVAILDGRVTSCRLDGFVPSRFRAAWRVACGSPPTDGVVEGGRVHSPASLRIERDASVRRRALLKHGKRCRRCELEPKHDAVLEVHHVKPLAATGERLTTLEDVVVLCRNCHAVAHAELRCVAAAA